MPTEETNDSESSVANTLEYCSAETGEEIHPRVYRPVYDDDVLGWTSDPSQCDHYCICSIIHGDHNGMITDSVKANDFGDHATQVKDLFLAEVLSAKGAYYAVIDRKVYIDFSRCVNRHAIEHVPTDGGRRIYDGVSTVDYLLYYDSSRHQSHATQPVSHASADDRVVLSNYLKRGYSKYRWSDESEDTMGRGRGEREEGRVQEDEAGRGA